MTTPRVPSTMIQSPRSASVVMRPTATTAGTSRARATMAVWLVLAPASVTKAATLRVVEQERGVGRREVVGHHHRPLGRQLLHVHLLAEQVLDDALADEVDVGAAAP